MSVLEIQFDNSERTYPAGGMMSGQISMLVSELTPCRAVLLEYWWEARGAGVTDRGPVHKQLIDVQALAGHLDQPVVSLSAREMEQAAAKLNASKSASEKAPKKTPDTVQQQVLLLEPRETYRLPFYMAVPPGPVSYASEHLVLEWHMRARVITPTARALKVTRSFRVTPGNASTADLGLLTVSYDDSPEHKVSLPSVSANSGFLALGLLALAALGAYILPLSSQFPSRLEDYLSLPAFVVVLIYVVVMLRALVRTLRARQFYNDMQVTMPACVVSGDTLDVIMRLRPQFSSPRQRLYVRLVVEAFEQTRSASQQHKRCISSIVLDSSNVIDLVSQRDTKV
ncbi:MAG: hypothetical protein AAF708_15005, partial [Deinococcota bacterium]